MTEYNDSNELADYVWNNYLKLFSAEDKAVMKAWRGHLKSLEYETPQKAAMNKKMWGDIEEPGIKKHLVDGIEHFRMVAAGRTLSLNSFVVINRCSECTKVLKTPDAMQCLWCGNDWH